MKILGSLITLLFVTVLLSIDANPTKAEGFFQVSLGGAFTEDADLDFEGFFVVPDVQFEDSVSVDIGGGGWFSVLTFLDLGIGAGLGYYSPTVEIGSGLDDFEFQLLPFSVMSMARVPLFKTDRRPHGLLQPYVAIGPSFVLSVFDYDDAGIDGTAVGFDVGFDFRAGVNINLTKLIGLFVEYKRTEVDSTLSDGGDDLKIDFKTDHIKAGIGFHF